MEQSQTTQIILQIIGMTMHGPPYLISALSAEYSKVSKEQEKRDEFPRYNSFASWPTTVVQALLPKGYNIKSSLHHSLAA